MARPKVLVVDDDHRHLEAAREQLSDTYELNCLDSYEEAIKLLVRGHGFHALLSDLLMPAEPYALGGKGAQFIGQAVPIGLILALRAALVGVPRIVVITDASHHDHPMSAALDWLNPSYVLSGGQKILYINDSCVLVAHAPLLDDGRKDWASAFKTVLNARPHSALSTNIVM